jgi:hypothetical protein
MVEEHIEDFMPIDEHREELVRTPTPIMAPNFITRIKDTRAERGHQAIFECVVPDSKGVVCKWLKARSKVLLNNYFQILGRQRNRTDRPNPRSTTNN